MSALLRRQFSVFRPGTRFAAVIATATMIAAASATLGHAAPANQASSAEPTSTHLHSVRALRLPAISAAEGNITVNVPDSSWGVKVQPIGSFSADVIVSSNGRSAPAAIMLTMIGISDILSGYYAGLQNCAQVAASMFGDVRTCEFNLIQHHAAVQQRQWTAADGMHALASVMPNHGIHISNLAVTPRSPTLAEVSYDEQSQSGNYSDAGVMQMVYAFNPYLSQFESGTPEYISLGFLSVCHAEPGQLTSFLTICHSILNSMRFSQALKTAFVQSAMNEYAQQVQTSVNLIVQGIQSEAEKEAMVAGFSQQMAALQAQRQQIIAQTNAKVDRGWWNALGGQADLRDPSTGDVWNVYDRYKYYCMGPADKLWGTDDARDLQSLDCKSQLKRVSP